MHVRRPRHHAARRRAPVASPASARSFQIPHPFENLHRVRESCSSPPFTARRQREAEVVDACGDILQRTGLIAFRRPQRRHAQSARPQTARTGARARERAAPSPARRNRRRPDRSRMPGARRAGPGRQEIRRHDRLDRAHRACAGRRRDRGWSCSISAARSSRASRRAVMASNEVREIYMGIAA